MAKTYDQAWADGGDKLSKQYGGDKAKFIAAAKKYNATKNEGGKPNTYKTNMKDFALGSQERRDEYTRRGWAQDATTKVATRPDLERAQSTVDKSNVKAKGGAGALPQKGAEMHKDKSGNVIINENKPGGGNRATIHKAGSTGAKAMGEGSTIKSSVIDVDVDPNSEYGKYKKSREGSGGQTHGSMSAPVGNKTLHTGMGYSEYGGRRGGKQKIYNKEGEKVAVIKKPKANKSAKLKLTRAGRKDEDTTLVKTKKSGEQKVKGAPKVKKDSARTVAKKTLGVGTTNPDGSPKEVKRSAIRKKAGEVKTKRKTTRATEKESAKISKKSDKSFKKFEKKQKRKGNWDDKKNEVINPYYGQ